ncbi:hypothetical protein GY12_12630 [Micrococcus luteus]|nr:hypothetical protein GY12_12630 [Micrococcus luteus]
MPPTALRVPRIAKTMPRMRAQFLAPRRLKYTRAYRATPMSRTMIMPTVTEAPTTGAISSTCSGVRPLWRRESRMLSTLASPPNRAGRAESTYSTSEARVSFRRAGNVVGSGDDPRTGCPAGRVARGARRAACRSGSPGRAAPGSGSVDRWSWCAPRCRG